MDTSWNMGNSKSKQEKTPKPHYNSDQMLEDLIRDSRELVESPDLEILET